MKILKWLLLAAVAIQLVPFGHSHTNPPVTKDLAWVSPEKISPEIGTLVRRACYDCHSNETVWPWYSDVAPVSWLVQRDVNDGRRHLNFSEWDKPQRNEKDVAEQIKEDEMPPWFYLPMHPAAKLTAAEKDALIAAAPRTLGPQAGPRKRR
jgi:cytochrome c551/c552